jgi:hypothetical protein
LGSGFFDALGLGDETRLDGQELPSLANHFMLNRNLPNCTEIPAPFGGKDCKRKRRNFSGHAFTKPGYQACPLFSIQQSKLAGT